MYSIMKRVVISVWCLVLCLASYLSAEKAVEISLRFSRQDALLRVVVEGDETIISGSTTIASPAVLRIDFPSPFELKKPQDFIFEAVRKDRSLIINLKEISDIRVYKLSNPSRIVAEMKTKSPEVAPQAGQGTAPQQKPPEQSAAPSAKQPAIPQGAAPPATAPPSPAPPSPAYRTVIIDPGHGGYDYGLYSQDFREKDVNLNIAKDLGALLAKKGIKVLLTRKVDQSLPLSERIVFANSRTPDLFLSIHAAPSETFSVTTAASDDAGVDPVIRLYRLSHRQSRHLEKSRAVARAITEVLQADFKPGTTMRELPLPVLSSLDAPAVLIEYPVTAKKTLSQKEREKFIGLIIKGLVP